jgi:hypothetical protein
MANALDFSQFFTVGTAAWTSTCLLALLVARLWNGAPAMFQQWIEWRRLVAAAKTADWDRRGEELARLDERCIRLEEAEQTCREELANAKGRIAVLEGYQIGQGMAAQQAAGVVALDRLKDKPPPSDTGSK